VCLKIYTIQINSSPEDLTDMLHDGLMQMIIENQLLCIPHKDLAHTIFDVVTLQTRMIVNEFLHIFDRTLQSILQKNTILLNECLNIVNLNEILCLELTVYSIRTLKPALLIRTVSNIPVYRNCRKMMLSSK